MRARLLAIIILLLFIAVPVALYWYFYEEKVAAVILLSESDDPYTVTLDGKLEYEYLPLLDKAFHYKSTCIGSCIFRPVPPLIYDMTISSSGRVDIHERLSLVMGEEYRYDVVLPTVLTLSSYMDLPSPVVSSDFDGYSVIGVLESGKVLLLSQRTGRDEVGVLSAGRFISLVSLSSSVDSAYLDKTRQYIIIKNTLGETSLMSLGSRDRIVFPFDERIEIVTHQDGIWKVRTDKNLYESLENTWKKNPRFTDFIDVSHRYRIGYIADAKKLALQNLPPDESVILLLDRMSTKVTLLMKGSLVDGLYEKGGDILLLAPDGKVSKIELKI